MDQVFQNNNSTAFRFQNIFKCVNSDPLTAPNSCQDTQDYREYKDTVLSQVSSNTS